MKHRSDPGGDALDQAARRAWQASLANVPSGIRRQLRAAAPGRPRPALGWPLAAACAAGALAVGLHLHRAPGALETAIPAPSSAGNGAENGEAASAWAALEQTPDFYLWLASADTAALELE
jgi:hypothetical protein